MLLMITNKDLYYTILLHFSYYNILKLYPFYVTSSGLCFIFRFTIWILLIANLLLMGLVFPGIHLELMKETIVFLKASRFLSVLVFIEVFAIIFCLLFLVSIYSKLCQLNLSSLFTSLTLCPHLHPSNGRH